MVEEVQKCIINNILLPEDDGFIDDKVHVCESEISMSGAQVNNYVPTEDSKISIVDIKSEDSTELHSSIDNVKVEDEENVMDEIKIEFDNDLLFCEHCKVYYKYYCITCGMLVHILNRSIHSNTDIKIQEELPRGILEMKDFFGQLGIFVLKVIPKGVRFGPFTGLKTSECNWKMKGGRFMISDDKSKFLNWMWYINPARSICEQNLLAYQYEGSLYYRSNQVIRVGEELLVYFGAEYEGHLNRDIEMDFMPAIENNAKDVFACTLCCLGFSTRAHLSKHKTVCLHVADDKFSIEELVQCLFCKIHLDVKEYSEYHMAFCSEQNVRKCVPLALVEGRKFKEALRREYKCHRCSYKTMYKADLTSHTLSQHYEVTTYICTICSRRFKTKASLDMHLECIHDFRVGENGVQTCSACNSSACACPKPKCSASFESVTQAKQFEEDLHKCASCDYQADNKLHLNIHVKMRHLEGFEYRCEMCQFKTNQKVLFEYHLKMKHPTEYNMCLECDHRTNPMIILNSHIKTKPFKKLNYNCLECKNQTS